MNFVKCLLITFIISVVLPVCAAESYLNYSQSADVFHIINSLSSEIGDREKGVIHNYWIKNFSLSLEDKNHLNNFKTIRSRYIKKKGEFDAFSLAFYRAKSVDLAMVNLKKVLKKDELKKIVDCMRHFRLKISKLVSQSTEFKGRVALMNKSYKKKKVFKAYETALKFFGLKKKYKAKVYFLWWPENIPKAVEVVQNVIFIKINPLKSPEKEIDEKYIVLEMTKSLFSSISPNQKENFEQVVFPSCNKDMLYDILGVSMGVLPYMHLENKKKFTPFTDHFTDKKANASTILLYQLYNSERKLKNKFYGQFAHKVKYVCDMLN